MYVVTGEKSYLLTDYSPSRRYYVVRFTDGNGQQWFQLAYRWLFWTFYLHDLKQTDYGTYKYPLKFESVAQALLHLDKERCWLDRQEKSRIISVEIVRITQEAK